MLLGTGRLVKVNPLNATPAQRAVLLARGPVIAVCGGVGTYKSAAAIVKLFLHLQLMASAFPSQRVMVFGSSLRQLKRVFLAEFQEQIEPEEYTYNQNKEEIQFTKFDAKLEFCYSGDTKAEQESALKAVRGANISGWYGVQPETLRDSGFFHEITRRVRMFGKAPCPAYIGILDLNPGNPSHFIYQTYFDEGSPSYLGGAMERLDAGTHLVEWSDKLTRVQTVTTPETSVYTQETIDEWQKIFKPSEFDRMVKGLWTVEEGRVYQEYQILAQPVQPIDVKRFWIGLDPGTGGHPFGVVWVGETETNRCVVIDEARVILRDRGIEAIAEVIDEKSSGWGIEKYAGAVIDWSDHIWRAELPKVSRTLQAGATGIQYPAGDRGKFHAVKPGVDLVGFALRDRRLTVAPNCVNLLQDFALYSRDAQGLPCKSLYDPHLADALRYAWIRISKYELTD